MWYYGTNAYPAYPPWLYPTWAAVGSPWPWPYDWARIVYWPWVP